MSFDSNCTYVYRQHLTTATLAMAAAEAATKGCQQRTACMGRLKQKQVHQLASLSSTLDVTPPHCTTGARGALIVSSPPIRLAVAAPVAAALCCCSRQASIIPVQLRHLLLKVPHSFNMAHQDCVRCRAPCTPASILSDRHTPTNYTP